MASLLSPRLLKRSLPLFAGASVLALVALFIYGHGWGASLDALTHVRPMWALAAVALASFDWWGGGVRIWLLTRFLHRPAPFRGMVTASGLNTWGSFLTPSQTGGGPVMTVSVLRGISRLMFFRLC